MPMHESSFHYHRLLRLHRPSPRLLKSLPADPRNDIDVSHSPYLDSSPALYSRSSFGYGAQDRGVLRCTSWTPSTTISMLRSEGSTSSSLGAATSPPQSFIAEGQSVYSDKHLLPQKQESEGIFKPVSAVPVTGNFLNAHVGGVMYVTPDSKQFMKDLLKETIPGAAFHSSARDLPPLCRPGTRLAVVRRCIDFISRCGGANSKRMRWVVGTAGVGKSAIMQIVAGSPELTGTSNASIFLSINGRNDGTKVITTLSYQFAAKSEAYCQIVQDEINHDPSLLQSSMTVQFEKFIVQPFIYNSHLNSTGRVSVIIDGLGECNNSHTQIELLRLITNFCILYPTSPIVWLIASRPERHLTDFFSRAEVVPLYEKEEILVDSDDARADVERFLRDALGEISKASYSLDSKWPDETDLWKLANASGGLLAYAQTAVRYIGDSAIGNPAFQLSDVIEVIENHLLTDTPLEDHSMALLDALYARILSRIPSDIMVNARKFLLVLSSGWDSALPRRIWSPPVGDFVVLCNWLGVTRDDAYVALDYLRSVLQIPRHDKAQSEPLKPFDKSFMDYISDYSRSGFSPDILFEAQQLKTRCAFRVLREAPDGINFGGIELEAYGGILARGLGSGDRISFTWLDKKDVSWNSHRTRLSVYKLAIGEVIYGVQRGDPNYQNVFCVHLLTARFRTYHGYFPLDKLRDLAFHESRYHEFMMRGIVEKTPLRAVDVSTIFLKIKLRLYRPATAVANLPDPWDASCTHERVGEWGKGMDSNWVTFFSVDGCNFCHSRLLHQLGSLKNQSPDRVVPVMFTSTGNCCVESRFVDEDGMSEWSYWFWCKLVM